MNIKHLLWSLTAASLVATASVGAARTEGASHDGAQHAGNNTDTLPGAVRQATERFQNINAR